MTNDLRQSIELLSLSTLELADRIQNELMDNPLLEEKISEEKPKTPELFSIEEVRKIEKLEQSKSNDIAWQDTYSLDGRTIKDPDAADRNQRFLESSTRGINLTEYLLSQLRLHPITKAEFAIGQILISMIDEKGFINQSTLTIANEFKVSEYKIKKVLKIIQELDPIGIGAKNVEETLLIQAKITFPHNSVLHSLIKNHINDLEKFEFKKIAKFLKITEEDVINLSKLIQRLQPFPANQYVSKTPDYVVPDVMIKEVGGEFNIYLNDEWLPKLSIQNSYKNILNGDIKSQDREYLQTNLTSAQWIIRSIQQRRQTLFRVVSCILDLQKGFFKAGLVQIKPLTLREVAEKLNLHESTISRITANKYIQTKWGIFELKWFFSSGLKSSEGGKESSIKIQELIKQMIKNEKEESPLSDQDIVEKMVAEGIEIARRTIAKYRKILKILPSGQRKKQSSYN